MKQIFLSFLLSFFSYNIPSIHAQINHWETAVYGSDTWSYFIGNQEPPNNWKSPGFQDGNWLTGAGSIGYGDNDDNTIIERTFSLYIRHTFDIVDKAAIFAVILQADYDDAFVAYLNGIEVARANILGSPPKYNTNTITDHEATLYASNTVESFFINQALIEDILEEGNNTLAIQIHNREGLSSSDMTANFFLTLGIADNSRQYQPTPSWFRDPFFSTPLPIVKISTTQSINENNRVKGTVEIINKEEGANQFSDVANEYQGAISIKHRGQSSLLFPKKNYSFETQDEFGEDLDTSFFHFPPEEDWILHGPFSDKSLMRNVLVMELARRMGQYASRTQYCELYVNGSYQGIYVLMEQIKRDKDRVDVAKLRAEDITGDELTGGYIFKIDKGEPDWSSNFPSFNNREAFIEYQLVYPDIEEIQPEQLAYIQSYINEFETAMSNPNLEFRGKSFEEYIDLKSFAEAYLLNELARNVDGYRLSSYFHKKKDSNGGKIFAGPTWDFNLAFRNADYCDGELTSGFMFYRLCDSNFPSWWNQLFLNEQFTTLSNCRWKELRKGPFHQDSIFAFIDAQADYLQPAINRNFQRWDILGEYIWPNPLPLAFSYQQEISAMKSWISRRLEWMDANIFGSCAIVSTKNKLSIPISIHPNPVSDYLTITFPNNFNTLDATITIYNAVGQQVSEVVNQRTKTIDVSQFSRGMYFLQIEKEGLIATQKFVVH